jgi:membrane-associated phospholipid phosphatase
VDLVESVRSVTSVGSTHGANTDRNSHRTLRIVTFWVVFALFSALTALVLIPGTPVLRLDSYLVEQHLWYRYPGPHDFIHTFVMFGQRGPATLIALPFFLVLCWRKRTTHPVVVLVSALVLLNVGVGLVKLVIGRTGPLHANAVYDVHDIFKGGDIFPSGHVSNTVVLYGVIAWVIPKFRKTMIVITVFLSVAVGLGTIYLRTHWFSDVEGGWLAGSLVLLALPTVLPRAQRWTDAGQERLLAWHARRKAARTAPAVAPPPPLPRPERVPVGASEPRMAAPGFALRHSMLTRDAGRHRSGATVDQS